MQNYLFLLLLLSAACRTVPTEKHDASPPNIIYIMADDLGYGDVGLYGQKVIQTPNIDALGKAGVTFTQHYAGTSVCAPSRAVLMTGRHMGHVPIRGNKQHGAHGQMPLPGRLLTVAEVMKHAGYATGMIGKWGLGISGTEGAPNMQGWDYFYGYTDQVLAHNYFPEYLVRDSARVYLTNEVKYLDSMAWHKGYGSYSTVKKEYSNDLFTQEALAYIENHQTRPFFLYLPYTIPHNNGEALPGQKQEVPDYGRFAKEDWGTDTMGYAAMIERLDGYVGQLVAKLEALGMADNTLLIFTSDNGPMQERVGHTAFFDSNGPLRGGKRDLYEGGIREPFVAKWPARIKPGRTSAHPSAFYDFLPTLCEIVDLPVPEGVDGISYLPALIGQAQPSHDFLYWEFIGYKGNAVAVRQGKWKGIRNQVQKTPVPDWELYDLDADPGETQNIAADHPDIVAELAQLAEQAHTDDPNWPLYATEGP